MVTDRESFPEQQCWTDENDGQCGQSADAGIDDWCSNRARQETLYSQCKGRKGM
jgi:hypothetical protein